MAREERIIKHGSMKRRGGSDVHLGRKIRIDPLGIAVASSQSMIGLTALAAWMTLLLGGRWRAERCGIDRLGRAIGAYGIRTSFAMVPLLMIA